MQTDYFSSAEGTAEIYRTVTLSWVVGNLYFFSATVSALADLLQYFPMHFPFKSTKRKK